FHHSSIFSYPTPITAIYTLSLHDALPIYSVEVTALLAGEDGREFTRTATYQVPVGAPIGQLNLTVTDANGLNFPDFAGLSPDRKDRKSTRLNSSHVKISYAVFCLKKKNKQ